MNNVIGGLDIKTNRNEKTDWGYASRRIDSVRIEEVIIVETTQCSQNGVGLNGKIYEIWRKSGEYLGSFAV